VTYPIVENTKYDERSQPCGGERVECLEEENKPEILRNLLECETNTGEGDILGNIEEKDRQDVEDKRHLAAPYCHSLLHGFWSFFFIC
jgi:hypothetical protein